MMDNSLKVFDWDALPVKDIPSYKVDGKRYYQTDEGDFPSMTTLLSILDDGGLDQWRKAVGEEKANEITQHASNRGNGLHDISENYLNNEYTEPSQIKGRGKVLFNKAKPYLDTIDVVHATEIPLVHTELGFAGTADAVVTRKGKRTTLDHKNARKAFNLNKAYMRRKLFKYYLQAVGYSLMLDHMYGFKAEKGMILVGDVQNYKATPFHMRIEDYVDEFMKLIEIYHGRLDAGESKFFQIRD